MRVAGELLLTHADSARAVGEVYGISLLASLPLVLAAMALFALRRAGAGTRAMACRAAVVALLAMYAGRFLPVQWIAWVAPEGLAGPLVALGRAQLSASGALTGVGDGAGGGGWPGALVQGVRWLYWIGVAGVLLHVAWWRWRLHRAFASGRRCSSPAWQGRVDAAARAAGVPPSQARRLRLGISPQVRVPMAWGGAWRPVIVLPPAATRWSNRQLHAALVHELSHLRHGDVWSALAARLACALFWFHPGAWWIAARLSTEAELACDDRVLLSGVRRSDYAELLARAVPAAGAVAPGGAVALSGTTGVRGRLRAIVDTSRVVRAPSRRALATASLVSAMAALPIGAIRVAPTRDVLTTLMRDGHWESRAYAVVHLAQRPDSVEVARDAAVHDPSPRVRAWAQVALSQAHDRTAPSPQDAPDRQAHRPDGDVSATAPRGTSH